MPNLSLDTSKSNVLKANGVGAHAPVPKEAPLDGRQTAGGPIIVERRHEEVANGPTSSVAA